MQISSKVRENKIVRFIHNKLAKHTNAIIAIFLIALFIVGILIFFCPYFLVSSYSVQRTFLLGNQSKQLGIILFNITSEGALTANYPIKVDVELRVWNDTVSYFNKSSYIILVIVNSNEYPPKIDKGLPITGGIIISPETKKGTGTILFPFPGPFSQYYVFVDGNLWAFNLHQEQGSPIFSILDYGVRLQIENSNKMIGLALITISLSASSFVGYRKVKEKRYRVTKKVKKSTS